MNVKHIEALGHFLAFYESDLRYFFNFKLFKDGKISNINYLNSLDHSFLDFLGEYGVARCIPATKKKDFLKKAKKWLVKNHMSIDVDSFAQYMKPMTSGNKIMTSLCSKVLMLNAPNLIFPIDAYTKKALKVKTNRYNDYHQKVLEFQAKIKPELQDLISTVQSYIENIEAPFVKRLPDIKNIRELRLMDKILWCIGKHI